MKTKELLEKLKAVSTAVATSGNDEISKSFLISDKKIYSYSEKLFCSVPLDTDLDLQVPAKIMIEFVKKLKAEEVELSEQNGSLVITSGKNKVVIKAEQKVTIPSNLVDIGDEHELPFNFGEGVVKAGFSVGDDMTRQYLSCVKVVGDKVQSTNNRTITQVEMDIPIDDVLYVPKYAVKNIGIINPTHYSISKGWLIFENVGSEVIFCCRTIDASKFPPLEQVFNRPMDWEEIEFPKGMKDSVDRAIVFAKHAVKNEQTVRIRTVEDGLSVYSRSGVGEYEDIMPFAGSQFNFAVNAKAMSDLLKRKPQVFLSGNIMKLEDCLETHLISLGS